MARSIGTLAVAGWVATACSSHAAETLKLTHQGIERTAILHRPAAAPAGPRPLVIILHGSGGGSAERIRGRIHFDVAADREGFVTLYPNAVGHEWKIRLPSARQAAPAVDDVGFIGALVDDLVGRSVADPARVYVTGPSRGGLMTFTLACALADRLAAAAPIIATMNEQQRETCRPARPIPIMVIAGTRDPILPYDGRSTATGRLLSVPDSMEFWRTLHGCTRQDTKQLPHRDAADPTRVTLIEWSGCHTDARLRLYRVDGGGHQLPSIKGGNAAPEARAGLQNRDIETAEEVWAFFKNVPR